MTDLRDAKIVWDEALRAYVMSDNSISDAPGYKTATAIIKADREQVERDTIRRVVEWLRANSGFEDCYSELRDQWLSDRIAAGEWKQ